MKTLIRLSFVFAFLLTSSCFFSAKKINVLIVTGGHDFDNKSFFEMFDSFKKISYRELVHPEANRQIMEMDIKSFDAVVFYDMPKIIKEEEKITYEKLVKEGKGLLFLHHSICSFQDWNEFKTFTGGKYYEKKKDESFGASSYQHDIDFKVHINDNSHPVTRGLKDFELLDEVYGNLEVLPGVHPLLSTDHPKSNKLIGWTLEKGKSRIVFIQPGHDKQSYFYPNYQNW